MKHQTHQNGAVSETKAITKLTEAGIAVSLPFTEERYDLIADISGQLKKIQVKRAYKVERERGTSYHVDFRAGTDNKPYEEGDLDVFIVHNPYEDELYWLEFDEVSDQAGRKLETWRRNIIDDSL